MNGQTPHLRPIYQPTTKSLNTGISAVVPAATILGIRIYATLAGGSTFYAVFGPDLDTTMGFITITQILSNQPTNTLSNTAGIQTPTVAPAINTTPAGGPPLPAGVYKVAYSFVTPIGETPISPASTITTDGTEWLQLFNGANFPAPAPTGYLTVELAVPRLEDWHVTRYAIFVSSSMVTPSCSVYVDSVAQVNLLDTTALGAQNSANSDIYLRPGQILYCQWTMADTNALATFSVYGEKTS